TGRRVQHAFRRRIVRLGHLSGCVQELQPTETSNRRDAPRPPRRGEGGDPGHEEGRFRRRDPRRSARDATWCRGYFHDTEGLGWTPSAGVHERTIRTDGRPERLRRMRDRDEWDWS